MLQDQKGRVFWCALRITFTMIRLKLLIFGSCGGNFRICNLSFHIRFGDLETALSNIFKIRHHSRIFFSPGIIPAGMKTFYCFIKVWEHYGTKGRGAQRLIARQILSNRGIRGDSADIKRKKKHSLPLCYFINMQCQESRLYDIKIMSKLALFNVFTSFSAEFMSTTDDIIVWARQTVEMTSIKNNYLSCLLSINKKVNSLHRHF